MKTILIFVLAALPLAVDAGLQARTASAQSADEGSGEGSAAAEEEEGESAAVELGERLFLETRFAQYFAANATDLNAGLAAGDPTVDQTTTTSGAFPGPFAGASMNCRACHLVDEHHLTAGAGNRTYADFARMSPVPERGDGISTTPRNSPSLVGIARSHERRSLFHFDGEFFTVQSLAAATLTGRNFGWLPSEHGAAVQHIAAVIRADDGTGALARAFGGSYRQVLRGGASVPEELRLPPTLRLDVDRASDEAILQLVSKLIAAYVRSLAFLEDEGLFDGSPFDLFLERNVLPRAPRGGQSALEYSRDVRRRLAIRGTLVPIRADGPRTFVLHDQPFQFLDRELEGLKIFLREPGSGSPTTGVGNCIACHPLPVFSDFRVHNTGVSQREYDRVHGAGSFAALAIPDLATRNAAPDTYLPATPAHPSALGPYRLPVSAGVPGATDLGLWNALSNPDLPDSAQQRRLSKIVCRSAGKVACRSMRSDPARLLDASIGLFKTPSVRDLGHSDPYFHDGSADTLEDVINFYVEISALARSGGLRNAAPELSDIHLGPEDVAPLAAFLRALNEDYE